MEQSTWISGNYEWLWACEQEELAQLSGYRAQAWLAGRLLAKQSLIAAGFAEGPADLSILSLDPRGCRNRPEVFCCGTLTDIQLSLSHTPRFVAAAWCQGKQSLGIDLAEEQSLSRSFCAAWFLATEKQSVATSADPHTALCIWTAKEATYKAAQSGEAFDPLAARVTMTSQTCGTVHYQCAPAISLRNNLPAISDVVWQKIPDVILSLSMLRNH